MNSQEAAVEPPPSEPTAVPIPPAEPETGEAAPVASATVEPAAGEPSVVEPATVEHAPPAPVTAEHASAASAAVEHAPVPSVTVAHAQVPSMTVEQAPVASAPVASAPVASAPVESAAVESAAVESAAVEPVAAQQLPADAGPTPTGPTPTGPASAEARRRLVERFEVWVDRMAAGEPPPPGVPSELLAEAAADEAPPGLGDGADLYAVVAGLTGLTGEVRLQGRAFKQLADVLAPVVDLPSRVEELAESLARNAAAAEDDERDDESALPAPTAMLEVLMDLYDRLGRGLRAAEAAAAASVGPPADPAGARDERRWLDRLLGHAPPPPQADGAAASSVAAMRQGYALTLSRLTAALHQWDVEPIGQVGEPFDPRRMIAIDVRPPGEHPPGTVCDVNRTGCAVRGTVLTPARVTVAR